MDWGFHPVTKESQTKGNRKAKKKADRGEFPDKVRKQIIKDQNGQCQICGRQTTYIHHVWPRGRNGRGVYTNGMLACVNCHNPKIHDKPGGVEHYINIWRNRYGPEFYMDETDKQRKGWYKNV